MSDNRNHIAGIIPAVDIDLDFSMEWEEYLSPLAPDLTMLERAIMECAYANVNTIWVILAQRVLPIVKHRIGEWIEMDDQRIPIFYVPTRSQNVDHRDTMVHSILFGCKVVNHVSKRLSVWLAPKNFYICFPYGVYNPKNVKKYNSEICEGEKIILSHNNKSILTENYFGFTIRGDEFDSFLQHMLKLEGNLMRLQKSTDKLTIAIADVFNAAIMKEYKEMSISWQHDIKSWDDYRLFLGSPESERLQELDTSVFIREKTYGVEFCKTPWINSSWNAIEYDRTFLEAKAPDLPKGCKLTKDEIREIRQKYEYGGDRGYSQRRLGREYNVSQMTIKKIVQRQRYKNVRD